MCTTSRLFRTVMSLLLCVAFLPLAPAAAAPPGEMPGISADADAPCVLVKARAGQSRAGIETAARRFGARVLHEIPHIGWYVLDPGDAGAQATASRMRSSAQFERVEIDVTATLATVPDDPLYASEWGLENTGQTGGTPGADIGAPAAWDFFTGSGDIVVAVVDTGADLSHPDLAGNAWINDDEIPGNGVDDDGNGYVDDYNGWDFANRDATPWDDLQADKHGTHVAGTIGAVGNNGLGVTGVSWDVRIMSCKFISPTSGALSAAAEAIVYAVDNGADVINHSWSATIYSSVLDDAIGYARAHDVINVAAAANNTRNLDVSPVWPASIEATNVITVAATDHNDAPAAWTNYGLNIVDLAAPGVDVTSTAPVFDAAFHITDGPYEVAYFGFPLESAADTETRHAIVSRSLGRLVPERSNAVVIVDDSRPIATGEVPGVRLDAYLDSVTAAGYANVSVWSTEASGTPSLADLAGRAAVWFTGRANGMPGPGGSLDDVDRLTLGAYLDSGGRLLLSSGAVGGDLDYVGLARSWYREYFHVACVDYDSWSLNADGIAGGLLEGLSIAVSEDDAWGSGWPSGSDDMVPLDVCAEPLMNWWGYASISGTSMSAPHVTGAIALLASAHPQESMSDIRFRIESTVDTSAALASMVRTGGRLDLGAAMADYPAAPVVVSPVPGDALPRNSSAGVRYVPRTGTQVGTEYEFQVGVPNERVTNVGFESGTLTGWTVGGSRPFVLTSTPTDVWSGKYAVRSGAITHSQSTYISSSVVVPTGGAHLTFRYWLDSEDYYDYAALTVAGSTRWAARSDSHGWRYARVWLPAGTFALRWTYYKDGLVSEGRDGFGLDEVSVAQFTWSHAATGPPESTEVTVAVPDVETRTGAIRVRGVATGRTGEWVRVENLVFTSDAQAPGSPAPLFATPGADGDVALAWTNPTDTDWTLTRVVRSFDDTPSTPASGTVVYEGTAAAATDAPLLDGVQVRYAAFARDAVGNWSSAATARASVIDVTPPPAVGLFNAVRNGADIRLTWMNVPSVDAAGTRVLRRGGTPSAGPTDPEAIAVYEGRGLSTTDSGVLSEPTRTVLYYSAFAYDHSGNFAGARVASLSVDTLAPSGTFVLDSGAIYTRDTTVACDSAVVEAAEMRFDSGGGFGPWLPYAAEAEVVLVGGDGIRTVAAQYRASSGELLELSDTIVLDSTAPAPPTSLAVTAIGRDWLDLAWSPSSSADVTSYTMWRATAQQGPWGTHLIGLLPASISTRDASAAPGATYFYRLTALDAAGNEGPPSAIAHGTPGVATLRLAGSDRYLTAIEASRDGFASAVDVVIATGETYADALAASSLAGALEAPVLLTRHDTVPAGVLDEIARLSARRVVIVGGVSAVEPAVETALQQVGLFTRRIAGADRYATAAALAAETLRARTATTLPGTVFVVRGDDFPDALAVAPATYAGAAPVLLVKASGVPVATADALVDGGYSSAIVVGGIKAVSAETMTALGIPAQRVWGADRYATSAAFAEWADGRETLGFRTVALTTGRSFPDALTGGAATGAVGGVVLLTTPDELSAAIEPSFAAHAGEVESLRVYGGETAISTNAFERAVSLLR